MKFISTLYLFSLAPFLFVCLCKGQGTIRVTFDGPPPFPPGVTAYLTPAYYQSIITFAAQGGAFTRRLSGSASFPDNGTAYIQPWDAQWYFLYLGIGRGFDVISVDLALYSASNLTPVVVRFEGQDDPSVFPRVIATTEFTVTPVFDEQGRLTFHTFYFPPEFRNIFYLKVSPMSLWSLDNLVIYVPEPSAGALLVLGAAGLLFWAVRRRQDRGGAGRSVHSGRFR